MTVGATLRHARVARSLTRDDVARATRIPVRMIAAIEQEDFASLPGGIFLRGYLRAYAREVGVDHEAAVGQYLAEHPPIQATPPPGPQVGRVRSHAAGRAARWSAEDAPWRGLVWPALAAALFFVYLAASRGPAEVNDPDDAGAAVPLAAASSSSSVPAVAAAGNRPDVPVGTTAVPVDEARAAVPPEPMQGIGGDLTVDLAVIRPCWLTVTVDGRRTVYRLVAPGERERQAGREVSIRAGDAGAVRLTVNGEAARPLGASGAVVTVRITRDNYRSLLGN